LVITWGGFALGLEQAEQFEMSQVDLVLPFVSLFAVLMVFLSLGFFLSMLVSSKAAVVASGFFLIASWFITSLAMIDERLEVLDRFSPIKYYQGGRAIGGLEPQNVLILFGSSLVLILLAWLLFIKRDLRFGSSGGFRLVFSKKSPPS
jgi:hypothetical protein